MSRGEWKYCVVTGTPARGFDVTGPFNSHDEASKWASDLADAWWVLPLFPPEAE